jgi:hypothetical protein
MDDRHFDAITRLLATPTSRRAALRRIALGVGLTGSFVGTRTRSSSVSAAQNADCAAFCQQLPPGPDRGACVSNAAAGTGLSFQCGPAAADPAHQLCGGVCVDTTTDLLNCGSCAVTCPAGQICDLGNCSTPCPAGQTLCGDVCASVLIDPDNCGVCGNRCTFPRAGATCVAGTCTLGVCDPGWGNCNGDPGDGCETDLSEDLGNCGVCGTVCPTPANAIPTCRGGACGFDCLAGFGNCDGDPATGCERNLLTDAEHCGACGTDCPSGPNAGPTCVEGACDTECLEGFSPCGDGGSCCPDGFCRDDGVCVGGICFRGSVGCNPGPAHCVCLANYAGTTICTPAFGAFCSAQRCNEGDPLEACPSGSYCIPTSCDGPGTISGRCAPTGACPTGNVGCGDVCVTGETCQADGICRAA